jgi:hypothetical protein
MFKVMAECSHSFMNKLEEKANGAPLEVEVKSLFEK